MNFFFSVDRNPVIMFFIYRRGATKMYLIFTVSYLKANKTIPNGVFFSNIVHRALECLKSIDNIRLKMLLIVFIKIIHFVSWGYWSIFTLEFFSTHYYTIGQATWPTKTTAPDVLS